jgi:hypothetical protein
MRATRSEKITIVHPYAWAWEPLESDPTFVLRPMFGTRAVYLDGKIVLCFSARKEPWHGVLVATDRPHHQSILRDFPHLAPHPILPKWLYLSDTALRFEVTVERLVDLVRRRDPRIGVEPKPRNRRKAKQRAFRP